MDHMPDKSKRSNSNKEFVKSALKKRDLREKCQKTKDNFTKSSKYYYVNNKDVNSLQKNKRA